MALPAAASVKERIATEQVALLYTHERWSGLMGIPLALLVAWAVRDTAAPSVLIAWLLVRVLLSLKTTISGRRFVADARRTERVPYWRNWAMALTCLDCLAWAGMIVLFSGNATPMARGLVATAAVGVAAIVVYNLAVHLPTALVAAGSLLLPSLVHYVWLGTTEGLVFGAGALIALVALTSAAIGSHRHHVELLRLRFENAALAEARQAALLDAQRSNEAKSRFLAVVSHEMRTPLNGIVGMGELLRNELAEPRQLHKVDTILRSAGHLNRVIGDLLDISRIEFGRFELVNRPFTLAAAIAEVIDLLNPVAAERGLHLRSSIAPELPLRVLADEGRLKQILHNLVGNALKFTARGSVGIEARLTPGGQLRIDVRDTGAGIAAADLARIFDAFEQAGSDAAASAAATGLGLTISRRLARSMGGDVSCSSTLGVGSVFSLVLDAPGVAEATVRAAGLALPQFSGCVLVVDDNDVNRLVASGMMAHLGLRSDSANDGEQALAMMAATRYDAVLMDCAMPRLDGLAAARQWRASECEGGGGAAPLPIIGVTAGAFESDRLHCLEAGMNEHLAKPFMMTDLAAALQRVLPRQAQA